MRRFAVAIATVTLVRLVVAAFVPLAPDETYYWVWSHALAGGYFDHPPMVALWIRAGTTLLGDTPLGVRLLGPLAAACASWMVFDAARSLYRDARAGIAAALLLNGTLLLGVGTVIMTPDSPLLFFWTATLWAMARLLNRGNANWWLVAGVFGGLALDSKYTALLLWIGIGLWVLLPAAGRFWLRRWQPWAAIVIGFVVFIPVLLWNADHHWVGFLKQGGRVGDWHPLRAIGFLGELAGSQIGLVTPLIAVLFVLALIALWRRRGEAGQGLLLALSLLPILVFLQHAIGDRVQGNWPAIIYPALCIASGGLAAAQRPRLCPSWQAAAALGYAITALVYLQSATRAILLPLWLDPTALQLAGWDHLARQTEAAAQSAKATFIAVEGYGPSSELAWHLAPSLRVIGSDDHWATTALPRPDAGSEIGLLLKEARDAAPPDPSLWSNGGRIGTLQRLDIPSGVFAVYQVTLHTVTPKLVLLPNR